MAATREIERKRRVVALIVFFSIASLQSCKHAGLPHEDYDRIGIGMSVPEVERILGPGRPISREQVPTGPNSQCLVKGDRFLKWSGQKIQTEIIIGFKENKVCDKWYWEPSL